MSVRTVFSGVHAFGGTAPKNDKSPAVRGFRLCAEEDSNLHALSVDRALNLVTRVSYPSYASISSRTSTNRDVMDVMDDLDVREGCRVLQTRFRSL